MATLIMLVDGTIPVAEDFNSNFVALNTETRGVSVGGTGITSATANGVLYGNGTSGFLVTAASTAANQVLMTTSAGGAPAFGTFVLIG